MKSRIVAAILTLLTGFLGGHRFYLGQPTWGLAYLAIFLVSALFVMYGVGILGWIALIVLILVDFVNLLRMNDSTFNSRYNHLHAEDR